jgi:Flp pilus assembly protein CpaB
MKNATMERLTPTQQAAVSRTQRALSALNLELRAIADNGLEVVFHEIDVTTMGQPVRATQISLHVGLPDIEL